MAHLAAPRIGWENEHLATFLLSRISFVANPVTVSDDIGSDFSCTIFEPRIEKGVEQLFPRNSFSIQIKSKQGTIDVTNKIEYLTKLELPFFVGVIDRKNLRLKIYSAEYLPILFCQHGLPLKLRLSPVSVRDIDPKDYCKVKMGRNLEASDAQLKMPFIMDVGAQESRKDVLEKARQLNALCSLMHDNLSARTNKEYIFKLRKPGNEYAINTNHKVMILAGSGSAQTFRYNFCLRLAEAFYNLEWIMKSPQRDSYMAEFEVYEKCYLGLKEQKIETPEILRTVYDRLKERISINRA